jgi:membrane-associated phospholipid phosphatase
MDIWPVITSIGLPEAWAAIAAGMVFAYLVLRHTSWQRPTPQRGAFKRVTVLLVFTLILAFVAVHSLKTLTRVPRDCTPCTSPEISACNPYCIDGDYSFPSGHAASIFSVCTLVFLMLRRRRGSVPAGLLFYLLAGLVAWSRVALGVHTIPDIAAGALIGLASALVIWKIRPGMGIFA